MFGFKPFKLLMLLALLFVIFSISKYRQEASSPKEPISRSKKHLVASSPRILKKSSIDATMVLEHLFHNKLGDKSVVCMQKETKKHRFIACKGGDIFKESFWEARIIKGELKLINRSKSAAYIIRHHPFKEFELHAHNQKLEETLKRYFHIY